ncbi:MAG TPA: YMGG-like glycine zipper-containing protein [Alphaproteobacteria bacterium]
MKRISLISMAALAVVALANCGYNRGDRALSGAAIGAGAGAAGGAIAGHPAEGALIGGAAGAGTGALTSPNDVNLGRPAWR